MDHKEIVQRAEDAGVNLVSFLYCRIVQVGGLATKIVIAQVLN